MAKNKVILTGFMGCGKSTIGRILAEKRGQEFLDTDRYIEQKQGRSISDIFATQGEEVFRDMETEALRELIQKQEPMVIALGGGLPIGGNLYGEEPVRQRALLRGERNRELLAELGYVFYLKITPGEVYRRLKGDTTRPLLQTEDPYARITELLQQRDVWYEKCADEIITVEGKNKWLIADEIIRKLSRIEQNRRKKMKILVINGPNLNFLGIREKGVYGTQNYDDLLKMISDKAKELGATAEVFQSNHEGAIIDRIQDAYFDGTEGIVINPGAFTHYSYAIRDALASVTMPKIEIHISDITQREEFRKTSVTALVCNGQIYGHGLAGYLEAMEKVANLIRKG